MSLVAELFEAARCAGLSSRRWVSAAGVGTATLHRLQSETRGVNALTVAKLGLAAGLRLELEPLRASATAATGLRQRPPVIPNGCAAPPSVITAEYLLTLSGAELRHLRSFPAQGWTAEQLARDVGLSEKSVLRAEAAKAPWPRLAHLDRIALTLGHRLAWQQLQARWRPRPWQLPARTREGRDAQLARARRAGARGALYLRLDETWRTPRELFADLSLEFDFRLDVAALKTSALCPAYLGPDHDDANRRDALRWQDWADLVREVGQEADHPVAYCNPPYGARLGEWTSRAARTAKNGVSVVGLLPARTDTRWFAAAQDAGAEVRFLRGRLHFNDGPVSAPFASIVVVWWG